MIEVIPAIDIIDGKCVRLSRGDFAAVTTYSENPVDMAKRFADAGLRRLHLVDLDGARSGKVQHLDVLEKISKATSLLVDFGGGIKTSEAVAGAFSAGAAWVAVGSIAVKNETVFREWIDQYGVAKFLLGADVKDKNIVVNGWTETSSLEIHALIRTYTSLGLKNIFCTDVSKDGMLQGPSTLLYKDILDANEQVKLIASGGVSQCSDIDELELIGCTGVIIGKAIYEGTITLKELETYAH